MKKSAPTTRRHAFCIALLLVIALSAGVSAQIRLVEPKSRALLGGSKTNCTDGTYLYLGAGGTIVIGRIVSVDSVDFLSEYYLPSIVEALSVRGNILFASDLLTGLHILDVTDPVHPQRLARLSFLHRSYDLLLNSNMLFIAHGDDGFSKVDISNLSHPSLIGSAPFPCTQLRTRLDLLYCVHWDIVTIASQSTLDSVGSLPLVILTPFGNAILGLEFSDSKGVLVENYFGDLPGDEWSYTTLLDMSIPSRPSRRGRLELPPLTSYTNRGDTLVCISRDTMFVISADSINHPHLMSRSTGVRGDFVSVRDAMLLASSDYNADFQIIGIGDIQNPHRGYYRSTLADVGSVVATDSLLVAGRFSSVGLALIDISDPSRPRTTTSYTNNIGSVRGVAMNNGLLYAASGEGLKIFRTFGVDSLSLVGQLNYGAWAMNLAVSDTLVVTGGGYYGVHLISVADPAHPRYITSVPLPPYIVVEDMCLKDTLLFVTGGYGGIQIYSIASPANPSLLWSQYFSSSEALFTVGNTLFVADYSTLRALDISTPGSPTEIGSYNLGRRIFDFSVRDSLAFVGVFSNSYEEDNGLVVLSVSPLTGMNEIARANTPGWPNAVFADDRHVFLSDHLDGVYIFDRSDIVTDIAQPTDTELPSQCELFQNYPNPFNPSTTIQYQIADRTLAVLKVHDLLGRELATLVNEVKQPGTFTVEWNGSAVSSGVYFCRLITGTTTQTRKLVLLK